MSEGRILKPDKDFSKDVDKALPEASELAKVPGTYSNHARLDADYSARAIWAPLLRSSRYWRNKHDK